MKTFKKLIFPVVVHIKVVFEEINHTNGYHKEWIVIEEPGKLLLNGLLIFDEFLMSLKLSAFASLKGDHSALTRFSLFRCSSLSTACLIRFCESH
jgi:hypothetical protein